MQFETNHSRLWNCRDCNREQQRTHKPYTYTITLHISKYLNVLIIWFIRRSNNLIVSSRTQLNKYLQSFDKSNDVILPCNTMSFAEQSVRMSQKRIFLSKWPLMMVDPDPSVVTKSLQLEPANFVSMHARFRRSHTFNVRSWLPVTTLDDSPRNLAAITLPLWPVRVCWKNTTELVVIQLINILHVLNCWLYIIWIVK